MRTTSHIDVGDFGVWLRGWPLYLIGVAATLYVILDGYLGDIIPLLIMYFGLGVLCVFGVDVAYKFVAAWMPVNHVQTDDKAVFITGCDSGFGRALARRLDQLGFVVYAGCLSADEEGAEILRTTCSEKLQIVTVDVTDNQSVIAAEKTVRDTIGERELWAVVNNAGIADIGNLEMMPMERFLQIVDVNTLGSVRVTKAFIPLLRRSRGRIVFMSSLASRFPLPSSSAYNMSKGALVVLADSLRLELKQWGVTVHTVQPSAYVTPMTDPTVMENQTKLAWENAPAEIKEEYGEEYLEQALEVAGKFQWFVMKNTNDVIFSLVDAVMATRPKIDYIPNSFVETFIRFLSLLPKEFQDELFSFLAAKSKKAATFADGYKKATDLPAKRVSSLSSYR